MVNLEFGLSRKSYSVKAAILQENEEKVSVEESFQPNSFPEDGSGVPPDSSSSSVLNSWVIKSEQSFNIVMTVNFLIVFDAFILYDLINLNYGVSK